MKRDQTKKKMTLEIAAIEHKLTNEIDNIIQTKQTCQ